MVVVMERYYTRYIAGLIARLVDGGFGICGIKSGGGTGRSGGKEWELCLGSTCGGLRLCRVLVSMVARINRGGRN